MVIVNIQKCIYNITTIPEAAQPASTDTFSVDLAGSPVRELNQALHNRKLIGQAVGILMERYRIEADAAFQFLVRVSSTSNIKLRDVADEVVTSSVERYRADS